MKLFYLVGEPGVGKSTLIKSFTEPCYKRVHDMPILHTQYSPEVAQIGEDREDFGGTDTLGYLQPVVLMWLNRLPYKFMLGEGDRLNNFGFFDTLIDGGIDLTVVALWNPELAEARREERAEKLGKEQSGWWLKTRRTKVQNAIDEYVDDEWVLDAAQPFEELQEALRKHEVIQAIERAGEDAFDASRLSTYQELEEDSHLFIKPQYEGGPTRVRKRRKKGKKSTSSGGRSSEGALTAPKSAAQIEEQPSWQKPLGG